MKYHINDEIFRVIETVSEKNLDYDVTWLSSVRRDTGGPGEDAAAEHIIAELEKSDIEYRVYTMDLYLSYPVNARLEILGEDGFVLPALTHSFGKSTGRHGVVGSLKYTDANDMHTAAGRVALVDGLQEPTPTVDAFNAGASAIVFINEGNVIHNMIATPVWGTPALSQLDQIPNIPVISIKHEDGERLKALLRKKEVIVRVIAEVKTEWVRSKLPEAIIRGAYEPDKFILVGGHYCSWEVGTTDNATGNACLLEMARVLNANRDKLSRTVRIAWWPGHSHGRYAGSGWYSDRYWDDLSKNCLLYYNIDSPGVKNATQYYIKHTSAEVQGFAQAVISDVLGINGCKVMRPSKCADQSFLMIGVPSCSTYSFLPEGHPDRKPWTGGSAGGWWWHSEFDTRDKADITILAKDTRLCIAFAYNLANASVIPYDFSVVADEAIKKISKLASIAGKYIDFHPLIEKLYLFSDAASKLCKLQEEAIYKDAVSRRNLNDTIVKLSRILNPVIYNANGRFIHDQAEVAPLRHITKELLYPVISAAEGIPQFVGTNELGFLQAEVVRAINMTYDAFDRAVEIINREIASSLQ